SSDASTFITKRYNISLRAKTNQAVQWQPSAWPVLNQEYSSPDISHLIQNIIDQPSWINGNDLVLIMKGTGLRNSWSYDGDPMKAAELTITFSDFCPENGILYVDQNATGLQDGSSWYNAYRSFEQALDHASHCPGIAQIWIADGTYSPYQDVDRSAGFTISAGLNVYGGFQGNETNINQRIDGMYPTILSGDIGTISNTSDNLYHVVTIIGGNILLDGLTIMGGLANGGTLPLQTGSGIYNQGILTCRQVTLLSNSAPSFYNATGSQLISTGIVQVKP
ncbi:MAG: hypothetical protein ABIQ02_02555, partial [Saprospiraceae bacterium]